MEITIGAMRAIGRRRGGQARAAIEIMADHIELMNTRLAEVEAERSNARNELLRMTAERDAAAAHARSLGESLDNTIKDRDAALANADRLRHTLAVALARFTEPGHIRAAGDCLRTGWVPSGLVNEWRALAEVTRG